MYYNYNLRDQVMWAETEGITSLYYMYAKIRLMDLVELQPLSISKHNKNWHFIGLNDFFTCTFAILPGTILS